MGIGKGNMRPDFKLYWNLFLRNGKQRERSVIFLYIFIVRPVHSLIHAGYEVEQLLSINCLRYWEQFRNLHQLNSDILNQIRSICVYHAEVKRAETS